ncbi:MAG: adenylate/guanylate cyclase domain-containing protein [Haliea sp.]|nr:MAG: adenylate/guanylate cyclase domain-containing protein [Haliea sp.]
MSVSRCNRVASMAESSLTHGATALIVVFRLTKWPREEDMAEQPFRAWLVEKSWAQGVRYSKVVACLLPPAALAVDAPVLAAGTAHWPPGFGTLLAWQAMAEAFFLGLVALDRWWPALVRGREAALNTACAAALGLATWIGMADGWRQGDLSIWATGLTFVATVMCTPRRIRQPIYLLSLVLLAWPAWERTGEAATMIAAMVHPFCVVFLCIELDKFTYSRNLELYTETRRAEAERARADKVLYNVLPASVADELKRADRVDAVKFENMGVLFADIAGFTQFSRALPPDALVFVLNQIFSSFDHLVERHGLEKIKTIGDAYMVVSHRRIVDLCALALEMREALAAYNRANGTALEIRIGIHAGPAVAGVIGVKRFLYDVWGDTVNVASRMEASGEPGQIHVTEAVVTQARESFRFEARAPVDIKGRGPMRTWWLLGPRAHPAGVSEVREAVPV